MIRCLIVMSVLLLTVGGCSFLKADPKVGEAKAAADAALDDAAAKKAELADAVERGDAEEIIVAKGALEVSLLLVATRVEEYRALVDETAAKYDDLGSWGSQLGALFGPVGAAAGGILGLIGAGVMGWARTRSWRGFLVGMQSAREELAGTDSLKHIDAAMKKHIPQPVQDAIRKLKKSGVIGELTG